MPARNLSSHTKKHKQKLEACFRKPKCRFNFLKWRFSFSQKALAKVKISLYPCKKQTIKILLAMKKIVFFLIASVLLVSVNCQTYDNQIDGNMLYDNPPPHINEYMLTPILAYRHANGLVYHPTGHYSGIFDHTRSIWPECFTHIAQPFHTDSILAIKGIAFAPSQIELDPPYDDSISTDTTLWLEIRNASLDSILIQKQISFNDTIICFHKNNQDYSTISLLGRADIMVEILFDSTIYITDSLFYVSISRYGNNVSDCYDYVTFDDGFTYTFLYHGFYTSDAPSYGYTGMSPVMVMDKSGLWTSVENITCPELEEFAPECINRSNYVRPYEICIFPIIGEAEPDTTSSGTDTTDSDTSSYINNIIDDNSVSISPNPAKDIVSIKSEYKINSIEITNMQGVLLETKTIGATTTSLSLSNYSNGSYFLKIYTDKGYIIKRVVKQ